MGLFYSNLSNDDVFDFKNHDLCVDPHLEVSDLRVRCCKFFTEVGMGLAIFFCICCLTIDLPEDLPYFRDMLLNIYIYWIF